MVRGAQRLAAVVVGVLALSIGWTASARSQTIVQNLGGGPLAGNASTGQSFTATLTGTVTQIQVRPRANLVTTLRFYNGVGSGVANAIGTPVSSQAVTLVDQGTNVGAFQTIVLTPALPVTAGQQYTFLFDGPGTTAFFSAAGDVYAGGVTVLNYSLANNPTDLAFTVTEVPPVVVPTLTEWAMIIFGLVLALSAAALIHRRRMGA